MPKKKVLLLSEGFGVGHTQAAYALSADLQLNAALETQVIELGSVLHPTLAPFILNMYKKTLSAHPKLYGLVYRQYDKSLSRFNQLALHRLFYAHTAKLIQRFHPEAIVCTHPFPNAVISRLKSIGLTLPLYTVITDYEAHGTWITDESDAYLVSTSEVKQKLIHQGVLPTKVKVTGIPVHPNFKIKHDKAEVRTQYKLKDLPTVLIMGGGWGLMDQESFLNSLLQWKDQLQFIICCGSNEKVRHKLLSKPLFQHANIHILGFTTEVNKLMDAADLLITKPGGLTCTEASIKGIPMLFYKPIPGQEEGNCQYFTDNGWGEEIKSCDTLKRWFQSLLQEDDEPTNKRNNSLHTNQLQDNDCAAALLDLLNEHDSNLSHIPSKIRMRTFFEKYRSTSDTSL